MHPQFSNFVSIICQVLWVISLVYAFTCDLNIFSTFVHNCCLEEHTRSSDCGNAGMNWSKLSIAYDMSSMCETLLQLNGVGNVQVTITNTCSNTRPRCIVTYAQIIKLKQPMHLKLYSIFPLYKLLFPWYIDIKTSNMYIMNPITWWLHDKHTKPIPWFDLILGSLLWLRKKRKRKIKHWCFTPMWMWTHQP